MASPKIQTGEAALLDGAIRLIAFRIVGVANIGAVHPCQRFAPQCQSR